MPDEPRTIYCDNGQYILNAAGEPEVAHDLLAWARWMETAERHVALDVIGDVRVSTVFLGLDHAFGGPVPVLWETMIFGGEHDGYCDRYVSRDDALVGHATAVRMIRRHPFTPNPDCPDYCAICGANSRAFHGGC